MGALGGAANQHEIEGKNEETRGKENCWRYHCAKCEHVCYDRMLRY